MAPPSRFAVLVVGPALSRGAGQRRLLPARWALWGGGLAPARSVQPGCAAVWKWRPRRALAVLRTRGAGRPSRGSAASPRRCACRRVPLLASVRARFFALRSRWHDNSRRGRWRPNGCVRPVLKHGPRSATRARVFGWQTPRRSESGSGPRRPPWREPPCLGGGGASSTDPGPLCGGI